MSKTMHKYKTDGKNNTNVKTQ